jgi:hypothetical protein
MLIILYFQCAVAMLKPPPGRGRSRKWGLFAYTTFLFVLGTIYTTCNLRVRQLSYIDNRGFPGKAPALPPGPIGYTLLAQSKPTSMLSNTSFTVANWMADGLLVSCRGIQLALAAAYPDFRCTEPTSYTTGSDWSWSSLCLCTWPLSVRHFPD